MAEKLMGATPKAKSPVKDVKESPSQIEARNQYKENPNIFYMNGESLSRPLEVPPDIRQKRWIFVGAAIIIASILVFLVLDNIVNAPLKQQAELNALLAQEAAINPPDILKLLDRSDARIKKSLTNAAKKGNYSVVDMTDEKDKDTEMKLVKIPSTLSEEEGLAMYAKGTKNLSAIELVQLLDGAWTLDVDRLSGLNISLHYADFKSPTLKTAITQAINSEGLNRGETTDSGEDDGFGNEYSTGTIMVNKIIYDWTVSATKLSDVYSTYGIPENASYVGIRVIRRPS